ncbi:MAG: nucleoside-diphosphate kinase [Dehalococcoidia bacterium]|nr:nucleoside-diphosphate kinase [Dehalococcoidia bacterium]MCH2531308.1 nucleoside-diphosphate kinase [Dehalococcoidia bacterium]HCH35856.1 nucleoside-diphosphate kinase [Dehalococcoidia bacterium]
MAERTLVLLKPDAVQRGLVGEIVGRLENRGWKIVGLKFMRMTDEVARKHYAEHVEKPFFPGLAAFMMSRPIIAIALEGENVVDAVRKSMGSTNPQDANPGTIRGDLAVNIGRNLIHGSDSVESAIRELAIFFNGEELYEYEREADNWVTES